MIDDDERETELAREALKEAEKQQDNDLLTHAVRALAVAAKNANPLRLNYARCQWRSNRLKIPRCGWQKQTAVCSIQLQDKENHPSLATT
jgi:hypothetical protein